MSYIRTRKLPFSSTKLATGVSLGAALLTGALSTGAYAAQTNAEDDARLSDVVVNPDQVETENFYKDQLGGAKFTQAVSQTPKTIQIIDKSLLEDQHATTLTEALRNSPGVGTFYVGENGNSSTGDSIYMRGFDSSGSIFVDGVRDLGAISRDVFNTEQVEVIKGPSGADYGRSAPSGSINMVTKQAWLDNHANLSASYSSENQKRSSVDLNRQLSEHSAARLNLMWEDSDIPGRDVAENKRWGIAPALSFGLGTDTRLKLNYLHVTQRNTPDGGALTIGLPSWRNPGVTTGSGSGAVWTDTPQFNQAPKPDSSNFYGTDADYDDVELDMITALIEQDIGAGVTLHNITRVGQTKQEYLLSAFMANSTNTWNMADFSGWEMDHLVNVLKQKNTILTTQTGLTHKLDILGMTHSLSYGVELTRERLDTTGVAVAGTIAPTNIYQPSHQGSYYMEETGADNQGQVDTAALYFFDHIELTDSLKLSTGLRFDHYRSEYQAQAVCNNGTGRGAVPCLGAPVGSVVETLDATDKGNLFTYQLGALYQLSAQGNVYLEYAVATQPPGGNSLKMSASESSTDNEKFDPQQARTIELGSKWQLFDDKMLLTAALYRTTVDNQVEQDPTDNQYYQNGEKQIQGVEISLVGQLTDNLSLSTGYTKLSSKVTSGSAKAKDGSMDLPYNPSASFTSWLTYRAPAGFTLAGGARYNGELKRGSDGAKGTPEYTDSYWVMDAMASYRVSQNLDVQFNLYNLLDEEYVAAINKSGYRYTPGAPRSALLGINLTF